MINELLFKKAVNGDKESFIQLLEPIKEKLYRVAFMYLKNEDDALDCIQESTVQLNEVILDKDEIIVSTTTKSDIGLGESGNLLLFGDIYINGRRISSGSGGSKKQIDEYTMESVLVY